MTLLSILFFSFFTTPASAGNAVHGEELFRQGKWTESADEFKRELGKELETGNPSHVSLYNLGTALAKSGANGEAYAVLLKAYFQNPFDADLNHNIALVKKRLSSTAGSAIPYTWISWWPGAVRAIPLQVWVLLSLISLAPALLAIAKTSRPSAKYVGSGLALLFLMISGVNTWQARFPVFSVTKQTQIRSGPETSFEEIGNMEPGSLVNVEELRDGWQKIRFQTQNSQEVVGWIDSSTTLRVFP